jgi:hypothetical protein
MEMVGCIVLPRVGNATLDSAGTNIEYRECHAPWAATTVPGGCGDNAYFFRLELASRATCHGLTCTIVGILEIVSFLY